MSYKEVTYNQLREKAFELKESNLIPKTLVFEEGSAFCYNVEDTLFNKYIPYLDRMVSSKEEKNHYDKNQMTLTKKHIYNILKALEVDKYKNVSLSEWRTDMLNFK